MKTLASKLMITSKILKSRAYERSKRLAAEYASRPDQIAALVNKSQERSKNYDKGVFSEYKETLLAFCRLLKSYAAGQYREIPWETIGLIAASLIYFVMPIDLMPDFIVALGLVDDAALIGWTLKAVKCDIDRFLSWENATECAGESIERKEALDTVTNTTEQTTCNDEINIPK